MEIQSIFASATLGSSTRGRIQTPPGPGPKLWPEAQSAPREPHPEANQRDLKRRMGAVGSLPRFIDFPIAACLYGELSQAIPHWLYSPPRNLYLTEAGITIAPLGLGLIQSLISLSNNFAGLHG